MIKKLSHNENLKIIAITLALIGGLHNLSGSIIELILPSFSYAHGSTGAFSSFAVGLLAIFFASLTLFAVCIINRQPKIAGISLIISAFGGLISISIFYFISFVMVFAAGIIILKISKK